MSTLTDLLASDPTVLAIINFVALLGAAWMIVRVLRGVVRFASRAYHDSLKVAWRASQLRSEEFAKRSAEDLTLFVAHLAVRAFLSLLVAVGFAVSFLASIIVGPQNVFWPTEPLDQLWAIIAILYLAQLLWLVLRAMSYARRVGNLRGKAAVPGNVGKHTP